MQIRVFKEREEWVQAVVDQMLSVIAYDSELLIGLAGGKTPIEVYRKLGFSVMDRSSWEKITFVTIDDRDVPYENPGSNFGMIKDALSEAKVIGFDRKFEDPVKILKNMERNLRLHKQASYFFDLLVLGMGEDGHVASIFPGFNPTKMLNGEFLAARSHLEGDEYPDRYTLTFKALNSSREAILLVKGKEKLALLKAFKQGDYQLHDANKYPIINLLKAVPTTVFALESEI